jgi:hypothetical protein
MIAILDISNAITLPKIHLWAGSFDGPVKTRRDLNFLIELEFSCQREGRMPPTRYISLDQLETVLQSLTIAYWLPFAHWQIQ